LRAVVAFAVCVASITLALLIARDCDAPDWQQGLMLTVLPLASGVGAMGASGFVPALLVGPLTWLGVLLVWVGDCSA
jgi:hypothetical protein